MYVIVQYSTYYIHYGATTPQAQTAASSPAHVEVLAAARQQQLSLCASRLPHQHITYIICSSSGGQKRQGEREHSRTQQQERQVGVVEQKNSASSPNTSPIITYHHVTPSHPSHLATPKQHGNHRQFRCPTHASCHEYKYKQSTSS